MLDESRTLLAGCLVMLCGNAAHAGVPEPPPAPAAQAVSQLLMLDALQAVAAERARQQTPAPGLSAPSAQRPDDAPRTSLVLHALYGVGQHLHAQVLIDGQAALYTSGHSQPAVDVPLGWRLKRIAPPCIDLEDASGDARRVCAASGALP